ncbi:MAG: hypothetical protein RIR45_1606 [Pseudomonadota bacterium]
MSLQIPLDAPRQRTAPIQPTAFCVRVTPGIWSFQAEAAETVLQAALRAGVELPSACRNGTCRVCLCRLEQGRVHYRIEWPGVSADEKREGYFLPCVAYAMSDLVIAQPDAALGNKPVRP